jgi:hypothetical protein
VHVDFLDMALFSPGGVFVMHAYQPVGYQLLDDLAKLVGLEVVGLRLALVAPDYFVRAA